MKGQQSEKQNHNTPFFCCLFVCLCVLFSLFSFATVIQKKKTEEKRKERCRVNDGQEK